MRYLFRAKRGEIFADLNISRPGGWETHGILDFGRRVEQRWPYYFLCRRAAEPWDTGSRPARRAEVALLFLVQEGGRTTVHWISAGASSRSPGGLTISCAGGPPNKLDPRGRPARRAEMALLFLAQEVARGGREKEAGLD